MTAASSFSATCIGTPCSEIADPVLARLCELEREIATLREERKVRAGAKDAPVRSKRA
jgi:hypothetical protein